MKEFLGRLNIIEKIIFFISIISGIILPFTMVYVFFGTNNYEGKIFYVIDILFTYIPAYIVILLHNKRNPLSKIELIWEYLPISFILSIVLFFITVYQLLF